MRVLISLRIKEKATDIYKKVKSLTLSPLSKNVFILFLVPIISSVTVALIMQNYFTKQQIKKELALRIIALEDEIVKYDELFINNEPLRFLINIKRDIRFFDSSLKFAHDNSGEAILKDAESNVDKALARYILKYTKSNLLDSNRAYLYTALEFDLYEKKYRYIQAKLKRIKEGIKILNNELRCDEENNILFVLVQELYKREEFNNYSMAYIYKTLKTFRMKYDGNYINIDRYEQLMEELTSLHFWEKVPFDNSDLINSLINEFIKINGSFILNYDQGKSDLAEYCKRVSL